MMLISGMARTKNGMNKRQSTQEIVSSRTLDQQHGDTSSMFLIIKMYKNFRMFLIKKMYKVFRFSTAFIFLPCPAYLDKLKYYN